MPVAPLGERASRAHATLALAATCDAQPVLWCQEAEDRAVCPSCSRPVTVLSSSTGSSPARRFPGSPPAPRWRRIRATEAQRAQRRERYTAFSLFLCALCASVAQSLIFS